MKTDIKKTQEALRKEKLEQEVLKKKVLGDISVVIQGKVFGEPGDPYEKQLTLQCIQSIKNLIPTAEIILSTWEGTNVSHLSYDKVVFNKDPGAITYSVLDPTYFNNNNRQISSTYNGLKAATKLYAIKMRGDCKLLDTDFTNYLKEYPRGTQHRFFKQRIVIPTKYTRNPRRIAQLIHPSDIFQVGLREDLLNLWDIPLQPEPQTTRAIPLEKKIFNNALLGGAHRMKFGAEQYIWYSFCKKNGLDLELKHYSHIPPDKILASEISLINNFVIEEAVQLGVNIPKRMVAHFDKDLYKHSEWLTLSKRYTQDVSKVYEWELIGRVYYSNVARIVWRAQHRLRKFGPSDFVKVLYRYISKTPTELNTTLNQTNKRMEPA
ncbi:MAG TPA: WavE lipopolysaccharide synthesis family protein [Pedobacter sp.]|jgi:hypothetical protein